MGVLEGRKSSGSPADWLSYGGDTKHTDAETLTMNDAVTSHGLLNWLDEARRLLMRQVTNDGATQYVPQSGTR